MDTENNTGQKRLNLRMEPLDLLYVLGTGSKWYDNELRYSLRSVCENFPHARVFIVGEYPPWLRGVHHIDARDPYANPLRNSTHKLKRALTGAASLGRFVLMNDDFFFLRPVDTLPLFHRGPLATSIVKHPTKRDYYFDALCWAQTRLQREGIAQPLNYGLHYPMALEREQVLATLATFADDDRGYLFRTMHGNLHKLGGELMPERGGRCPVKLVTWEDPADQHFVSTSERATSDWGARRWFAERFPEPCRYEA
jgi:hypothetical protein